MTISVSDPLNFDLTFEACKALTPKQQPLFVGGTVSFRFCLKDSSGNKVQLVEGTIVYMYIESEDGTDTITRSSLVQIPGEGIGEIKIDAGQTVDSGATGKGWYECYFRPSETVLVNLEGTGRRYRTKIALSATNVIYPHFQGRIDIGR